MKCLTRYLSVFCCFLLLFTSFSVRANAKEQIPFADYKITSLAYGTNANANEKSLGSVVWTPFDDVQNFSYQQGIELTTPTYNPYYYLCFEHYIESLDGAPLLVTDSREIRVYIENMHTWFKLGGADFTLADALMVGWVMDYSFEVYINYADGTEEVFWFGPYSQENGGVSLDLLIEPAESIQSIDIKYNLKIDITDLNYTDMGGYYSIPLDISIGELAGGDFDFQISAETQTETLLGGLLDKVTGGFESVGNWFSDLGGKISSGFSDVTTKLQHTVNNIVKQGENIVNSITNLPAKIWEFIENGLKSLFVPDDEYMASYKDKWDSLLADRLGAVYQVVQITFGAWEDIQTADEKNTINIPVVTIPLLEGQEFSFGGYDVKIVPDGFDILVTSLKSIVGIVCTIMFINGLRKRYDEIMGVEQ